MIRYDEYQKKIDNMKKLFFTYKNYNTLLQMNIDFLGKHFSFKSRRTIHNLKYSLRPNLTEFVKEFCFFDFATYWRKKKIHNYLIFTDNEGRISFISVDNKNFIELWIYNDCDVLLIDYYKINSQYKLISIGKASIVNNRVIDFTLMEIEKEYSLDVDFILRTEQYLYSENKLIDEVITYIYDSRKKMTTSVDVNSNVYFSCISHNTIYANPEIYKHEFTYNEDDALSSAVCFNYFNPSKKANLTITSNNDESN